MRRRKRGTRIFVPREIWDKYLLHGVREPERSPEQPLDQGKHTLSFRGSKYYQRPLTSRKTTPRGRIFEPRRAQQ